MARCPSCQTTFEPSAGPAARATAVCPSCRHVVVVAAGEGSSAAPDPEEPGTAPLLVPLGRGEGPTEIGVAGPTLSLPARKRVAVAILSGPRKGDAITLQRPRLTVGRDEPGSQMDVLLSDPEVSREHAAIECHGDRITLRDLGSRHGTFLGGERIGLKEVSHGAEFRVGNTSLMVVVTDT